MPVYEFDRLAPDLTLNEIIEARRRGKLNLPKIMARKGPYAPEVAEGLRKLREALALTGKSIPKPPVTHMNRTVLLKKVTEFDARLDRIIHGDEAGAKGREGESEQGRVTEFDLGVASKAKAIGGHLKRYHPAYAGAIGGGVVAAGLTAGIVHHTKKQNRWRESAGNNDFLKVGGGMAIDKHGALYPMDHPKVKKGKVTEFAVFPAVAGGILGSGVGARLSGKKYNPQTGKWEDAQGNEVNPPGVSSALGATAGAGVGLGLTKAHSSVMKNYGGAGGVKEAYRNITRNVATQAGQKVTSAIAPSYAEGADILKKLRKSGSSVLKKFFNANESRLIELDARLGKKIIEFSATADESVKKKAVTEFGKASQLRKTGRFVDPVAAALRVDPWNDFLKTRKIVRRAAGPLAVAGAAYAGARAGTTKKAKQMSSLDRLVEFEQPEEKKRSVLKPYMAGLLTVPAIGAAVAAAGPGRHMLAGAAEAIRARRYKKMFPAGSNIPPSKVVDFLQMLHTGKIKA